MRNRRRLIVVMSLVTTAVVIVIWIYNFTVTPLDRAFFLSSKKEAIIATRVEWLCNCASFVDTIKYKTNPVTEPDDNDYFFIEAAQPGQQWDRDHFIRNKYVKLTGQFYIDKGIPDEYGIGHIEDKPDHARIFKYDKIEYLTADN